MFKIGMTMLGISVVFGFWGAGVQARTLPTDMVTVIKHTEGIDNYWVMYSKKFSELKFDATTINRIKAFENKVASEEYNGASRFRLTNVRIWEDKVQNLLFRNDYGDVTMLDLSNPNPDAGCFLTFSGNGFSRCIQ